MPCIQCGAVRCVFNTHGGCSRNDVTVGGKARTDKSDGTSCRSFSDKTPALKNCAVTDGTPCDSCEIACRAASCVYNGDGLCTANIIRVENSAADAPQKTRCGTFRLR